MYNMFDYCIPTCHQHDDDDVECRDDWLPTTQPDVPVPLANSSKTITYVELDMISKGPIPRQSDERPPVYAEIGKVGLVCVQMILL